MATTEIRVRTDKATLARWAAAMANLRRTFTLDVKAVGSVAGLPALPATFSFTGVALLLDIGLASTRPHVIDDPARLFALVKYAEAISDRTRAFRLAQSVRNTDTHKRRVLSDEFGAGFSFQLARFLLNTPQFLDLKTALDRGWVAISGPKSRQPDYVGRKKGPDRKLIVLEAKGTQSGATYSRKQVVSGCNQVAQCLIKKPGIAIAERACVAISLTMDNQRVSSLLHVGDPPAKGDREITFQGEPEDIVVRTHYARVASLTGDEQLLGAIEGRDVPMGIAPLGTIQRKNVPAQGSRLIVEHDQSRMSLFVGLETDVRDALLKHQFDAAVALVEKRRSKEDDEDSRWRVPSKSQPLKDPLEEPAILAGEDGATLQVSFEGSDFVKELEEDRDQHEDTQNQGKY